MSAELILSRLEGVRGRGADRWSARCPAHADRTPSLSVGALPDGRALLKCYAGCPTADVLDAIGLDMTALFPPKAQPGDGYAPQRRRRLLSAAQALELLQDEAQLVALVAANIRQGVELAGDDLDRVMLAAGRIAYLYEETRS